VLPGLGSNRRFTQLLRDNYCILGPMGAPGINVQETRFPVSVPRPTSPGGEPDFADVIYGIHRCSHGHGDELPDGFELMPDAGGPLRRTHMSLTREGGMRVSDRVIFGLLAVAVLNPVNKDQSAPPGYYLTYGAQRMLLEEWWGRARDFPKILAAEPELPCVKLDFSNWKRT